MSPPRGVFVSSNNNVILHNSANGNAFHGIEILGSGNPIEDNTELDNVADGNPSDLQDDNGNCTHNTWIGNSFVIASPGCIQ